MQSSSDAYSLNESTGEMSIFTESASKNGKTETISVQPYLTDYSWILGTVSKFTVTYSMAEVDA